MARDHDGRGERALQGQGPQHLEPPFPGHLVIHHEHSVDASGIEGQPAVAIASNIYSVSGSFQRPLRETRLSGIIFEDQDTYTRTCGHSVTLPSVSRYNRTGNVRQ